MKTPADAVYRFGQFEVNAAAGELWKNGKRVKLQEQPFRLLVVLLEHAGEVVGREELRDRIWPEHTFVDFDGSLRVAVRKLREALGDDAEVPRYVETVHKHGYRFLEPAIHPAEPGLPTIAPSLRTTASASRSRQSRYGLMIAIALAVVIAAAFWLLPHRHRKVLALTEKDTVVLADFQNSTGDPVFDGTLREGLAIQLAQSPLLSIIPDGQVQQTLKLMEQKPDAKLTPEVARELCQRTGSAADLEGSIAQFGAKYLLTLKAVDCADGQTLASTETQASDKNHVLDALGQTASEMREKLGESLSTVKQFNTPLEQATTPSLEALQAYSFGRRIMSGKGDWAAAIPFFQHAISLDPNFALAYSRLGMAYRNLGQTALGAENAQKAYQLRAGVSQVERFYIESHYYMIVTGDWEKARQICEVWVRTYPRDFTPRADLHDVYAALGQPDQALAESREAVRLYPNGVAYAVLANSYQSLNRLAEAKSTVEEAQKKNLDHPDFHFALYQLAFLESDTAAMAQQVAWAAGKPGSEDVLLWLDADTKAYSGQLNQSRDLSARAMESAVQAEKTEVAAGYKARAALREAIFGNATEARQRAQEALGLSKAPAVEYLSALSLAMTGDSARAQMLADDLTRRFPQDTIVRFSYLPVIRAQVALSSRRSSEAIEALQPARPYDLSDASTPLYSVYVRGEAYLEAHQGGEAATEFQKIPDHRGIVANNPIGALAYLQLGRAYALSGDNGKAKAAYRQFLTLWKDADPDVPILKQAKTEYALLK